MGSSCSRPRNAAETVATSSSSSISIEVHVGLAQQPNCPPATSRLILLESQAARHQSMTCRNVASASEFDMRSTSISWHEDVPTCTLPDIEAALKYAEGQQSRHLMHQTEDLRQRGESPLPMSPLLRSLQLSQASSAHLANTPDLGSDDHDSSCDEHIFTSHSTARFHSVNDHVAE